MKRGLSVLGVSVLLCSAGVVLVAFSVLKLFAFVGISPSLFADALTNPHVTSTSGRTNILVLGIPGGDHEGALLTDAIHIISIGWDIQQITLLSIPRDMWSDSLQDKINSAYYYGETQARLEGGEGLAKASIEEITGVPIHYTIRLNFSGFEDIINTLGGIEVQVVESFTDEWYPIAGKELDPCDGDPLYRCRYETVQFREGIEFMDGKRALSYVRSRHAQGNAGTDFARGKRQQAVLEAISARLLTLSLWHDPEFFPRFKGAIEKHTKFSLSEREALSFIVLGVRTFPSRPRVSHLSLEEKLVVGNPQVYQGRYVLVPLSSLADLHTYITASLSGQKQ